VSKVKRSRFDVRPVLGIVVLLAVMGAACATKAATTGGTASPTPTPAMGGGYGGGGYGGGGGTGSPTPGATGSATITQGAGGQLAFSPATLTVKQGDTIEIQDVSSISHTFTIDGQGIDLVNTGGQSQTITLTLAPGTYTFICRFHATAGMKGTLTVSG
jgi:plastocyanin